VLLSGKSFFLSSADNLAIADQGGVAVVIEGRNI